MDQPPTEPLTDYDGGGDGDGDGDGDEDDDDGDDYGVSNGFRMTRV